ncbi:MAG TPA: SH3 domain-containing protein [Phaeodactylibacter sp.]|nr:SH3 domain-containing protein [Phaeodactylibacter sp.]
MKKILFIVFLISLGFIFSCKNTNSSESTPQSEPNLSTEKTEVTDAPIAKEKAPTILYAWVDKLRIREQPTTKSKIVMEVKEGTSFTYLNEKTDYKERINLRGTLYNEPWLKIKTKDGKEGWVYGGAIKFYEPVVDISPSPYAACFELLKDGREEKAVKCFEKSRAKQLRKNKKQVQVSEDKITLTLLTGEKIEIEKIQVDTIAEDSIHRFFNEYISQLGFFVIENKHTEYSDFSLINDKSGKEHLIDGFPKIAPNAKFLLAFNGSLMEKTMPVEDIQIYGFPNGRFRKVFEKDWENLEPFTPKWIDDKTIEVTLLSPLEDNPKEKIVKIILNKSGVWEVKK